jgi:hypothetical protein
LESAPPKRCKDCNHLEIERYTNERPNEDANVSNESKVAERPRLSLPRTVLCNHCSNSAVYLLSHGVWLVVILKIYRLHNRSCEDPRKTSEEDHLPNCLAEPKERCGDRDAEYGEH